MTTATATMTAPQAPPTLDRIALWLLMLFVASLQMSIFAAGILLSMSLFGVALARLMTARVVTRLGHGAAGLMGVASIALGVFWILR